MARTTSGTSVACFGRHPAAPITCRTLVDAEKLIQGWSKKFDNWEFQNWWCVCIFGQFVFGNFVWQFVEMARFGAALINFWNRRAAHNLCAPSSMLKLYLTILAQWLLMQGHCLTHFALINKKLEMRKGCALSSFLPRESWGKSGGRPPSGPSHFSEARARPARFWFLGF